LELYVQLTGEKFDTAACNLTPEQLENKIKEGLRSLAFLPG